MEGFRTVNTKTFLSWQCLTNMAKLLYSKCEAGFGNDIFRQKTPNLHDPYYISQGTECAYLCAFKKLGKKSHPNFIRKNSMTLT